MEKEVIIKSDVLLNGTLSIPNEKKDSYKAVLLISGSGPIDRDGNYKNTKTNVYKHLSDFFVSKGYITLRYDKRGTGKSEGNYYTNGLYDLLNDLDSAYIYLENHELVDKDNIILCGHSEGSILSTIYAKNHNVNRMILLSGAGIGLRTAVNAQNESLLEEIKVLKGFKGKLLRLLVKEEKVKKQQEAFLNKVVNTNKDFLRVNLAKIQAKWMREHFEFSDEDIVNILSNLNNDILCLTGLKDVQASPDDLDKIIDLNKENIKVVKVENLDHMLRYFVGEKTILNLKKQYLKEIKNPLSEDLYKEINEWL